MPHVGELPAEPKVTDAQLRPMQDLLEKRVAGAAPKALPLEKAAAEVAADLKKESETEETRNIFMMAWRRGPIRREKLFWARNAQDALRIQTRAIAWMNGKENSKCVAVGVPKPGVLDLEKEMAMDDANQGRSQLLL